VALAFVTAPVGAGAYDDVFYRPVVSRGQETSLWCWAAAVEMIRDSLGDPIEQCTQANRKNEFSLVNCDEVDCCKPDEWEPEQDFNPCCVKGGWPNLADLPDFTTTDLLEWSELKNALRLAPVAFSWRYESPPGSGHMLVATGYVEFAASGDKWVLVNDPFPPHTGDTMLIPYERYVTGSFEHWRDYYMEPPEED